MCRSLWATIITLYATIYHSISPASQVFHTDAFFSLCLRTTISFLDPQGLLISRLTFLIGSIREHRWKLARAAWHSSRPWLDRQRYIHSSWRELPWGTTGSKALVLYARSGVLATPPVVEGQHRWRRHRRFNPCRRWLFF